MPLLGKLNKNGDLEIARKGKYKIMQCHLSTSFVNCGDICPLFGEPYSLPITHDGDPHTYLSLCHTILTFHEFQDLRKGTND